MFTKNGIAISEQELADMISKIKNKRITITSDGCIHTYHHKDGRKFRFKTDTNSYSNSEYIAQGRYRELAARRRDINSVRFFKSFGDAATFFSSLT